MKSLARLQETTTILEVDNVSRKVAYCFGKQELTGGELDHLKTCIITGENVGDFFEVEKDTDCVDVDVERGDERAQRLLREKSPFLSQISKCSKRRAWG